MYRFSIIVLLCFIANISFAQKNRFSVGEILNKKWFPQKMEEKTGEIFDVPAKNKKEYIKLYTNGNFESMEGRVIVKGKWEFNSNTETFLITQNSSESYPAKVKFKVISYSNNVLVLEAKDAGGDIVKIYFRNILP